jgi:hypothetical protein
VLNNGTKKNSFSRCPLLKDSTIASKIRIVWLGSNYPEKGESPSRSLYDMTAVAILKNPEFAKSYNIPALALINGEWVEQPDNKRVITVWENFDRDAIMKDFYSSMDNYSIAVKER